MGKIIVINYGMGNIGSIVKKLNRVGISPVVSFNKNEITSASKIILPGVGHFGSAVKKLKYLDIWDAINNAVIKNKVPILGICLGMQLMAKSSEEGTENGFGWVDAEVVRFKIQDKVMYKIPHTGWNHTELKKESCIFNNVDLEKGFYFVHSYHIQCNDSKDILCTTEYSYPFVSAIQKDNIFGVQFHPEKSHDAGEQIFSNFIKI